MYSGGGRNLTPKVKKGCREILRSRVRIKIATVQEKIKLKEESSAWLELKNI